MEITEAAGWIIWGFIFILLKDAFSRSDCAQAEYKAEQQTHAQIFILFPSNITAAQRTFKEEKKKQNKNVLYLIFENLLKKKKFHSFFFFILIIHISSWFPHEILGGVACFLRNNLHGSNCHNLYRFVSFLFISLFFIVHPSIYAQYITRYYTRHNTRCKSFYTHHSVWYSV